MGTTDVERLRDRWRFADNTRSPKVFFIVDGVHVAGTEMAVRVGLVGVVAAIPPPESRYWPEDRCSVVAVATNDLRAWLASERLLVPATPARR